MAELVGLLGRAERLAAGAQTRLARRVADSPVWRREGFRSPSAWIAKTMGTTVTRAREQVRASEDLSERPHLDAALGAGAISREQATAISAGIGASQEAEAELVGRAADGTSDLADLRRRSRELVAAADADPEATRRRHHRDRGLREWTDPDGQWHAKMQGPAEAGAMVRAAIKQATDAAFRQAQQQGRRESVEAYAFDWLLATLTRGGDGASGGRGRERKVIGIVDVAALQRGHLHEGDTCRLAGVGPVSLSAITDLLGEATAAVLVRKGTVDLAVAHLGRQPTAFQRTALEARDYVCGIQGCGATRNLEIDHVNGWAETHQTRLEDLEWVCGPEHDLKTRGLIRLTGPPGNRTAIPTSRSP